MKAFLLVALLGTGIVVPAASQQRIWEPIPARDLAEHDRLDTKVDYGDLAEGLTEAQLARRLSQLYRLQSFLLWAQADGDRVQAADVLRTMMTQLDELLVQPGILEDVRYRELYRSAVVEHDQHLGSRFEEEFSRLLAYRPAVFDGQAYEPVVPSEPLPAPEPEPVVATAEVAPVRSVIPLTEHPSVERIRPWFYRDRRSEMLTWIGRADTLFPMIEQILAEEGVPDELKYLPIIESGLNPRARSTAHAVGIWQFIGATGRAYGLESDSWVDERMDWEKATRAAARHLKDLHTKHDGNWHVALAAYNCSPRCIQRAIRANGGVADFWGMRRHLPPQTQGFVSQFVALAQIFSDPETYGLPATMGGAGLAYDVVPVTGTLALATVASMVGTTTQDIERLNPELVRNALPPGDEPYALRLPAGSAQRFATALESLPQEAQRAETEYVVRRGDALGRIAARYGVTVQQIMQSSGLSSTRIFPGQRLNVSGRFAAGGPVTLDADRVQSVDWGNREVRLVAVEFESPAQPVTRTRTPVQQTPAPESATPSIIRHTVRRGDTLSGLAERYNTTVTEIRRQNNLRSSRIYRNQVLRIQPGTGTSARVHVVQRGETLSEIAARYGTTTSAIRAANNLRTSVIHPGQRLTIGGQ